MAIEINGKDFEFKPKQKVTDNKNPHKDFSDLAITRDESKCVGCGLCRIACLEHNGLGIPVEKKVENCSYYRPDGKLNFSDSKCTRCGQCVIACPTGALSEKENINEVIKALEDPEKIVIAQTAPSVRVSLDQSASDMTGKMVSALKKLGFNYVFDVNLGADFTTYEEAYDLKECIENNNLPLLTSCCPSRVKYIEDFHPELIPNITSVRSPQQCLAVLIKTYFAQKQNIDPKNIVVVSVMPCVAKKFESRRQGEDKALGQEVAFDVDWSITTREFIKMLKNASIDIANLEDAKFDSPLGDGSGAGAIYGASGGVMESAVRTFADVYHNEKIDKIDWQEFRGMEGIKKATVKVDGKEIKIAIATGLANAEKIFDEMKSGETYHYVEVMACPGGCVGGGGQPKPAKKKIIDLRRRALYEIDKKLPVRKAHENPILKEIYKEFLQCAGSEKAQKYLHTTYNVHQARICKI